MDDKPKKAVRRARRRVVTEFDAHDGTIQALYGLALHLENCIHLIDQSPAEAKAGLDGAISRLNGVIGELRNRIGHLE